MWHADIWGRVFRKGSHRVKAVEGEAGDQRVCRAVSERGAVRTAQWAHR